ncbi:hypothetical protein ABZT17_02755 [Streptomyces sp. NPDC005648]|uniref:hypothetical protein n=1 Tax=Streptomyces sp. NPDC005648 TaxID=3157044 RepID=UPI00339FE906
MDYRPLLTQHAVQLTRDVPRWDEAARLTGLDPYVCKASYVCGVMRELMQASGLNFAASYHLGSLFLALDATELLGRVVAGKRGTDHVTQVLRGGVGYLENHGDPEIARLPHSQVQYAKPRNFAGHGASQLPESVSDDGLLVPGLDSVRLGGARWTLDMEWPPEVYTAIRSRSVPVGQGVFVVAPAPVHDHAPVPQPVS